MVLLQPTIIRRTTKVARTAKHWNSRSNHLGCGTRNDLKMIATAAKRIDNANQMPISPRIQACPTGATVIADEIIKAPAKRTQRYQERVMMVMAIAAGKSLLGHCLLSHCLPLRLDEPNMVRNMAQASLNECFQRQRPYAQMDAPALKVVGL